MRRCRRSSTAIAPPTPHDNDPTPSPAPIPWPRALRARSPLRPAHGFPRSHTAGCYRIKVSKCLTARRIAAGCGVTPTSPSSTSLGLRPHRNTASGWIPTRTSLPRRRRPGAPPPHLRLTPGPPHHSTPRPPDRRAPRYPQRPLFPMPPGPGATPPPPSRTPFFPMPDYRPRPLPPMRSPARAPCGRAFWVAGARIPRDRTPQVVTGSRLAAINRPAETSRSRVAPTKPS
jgi:hypothetical protein